MSNCAGSSRVVEDHLDLRHHNIFAEVSLMIRPEYRFQADCEEEAERKKKGALPNLGGQKEKESLTEMIGRQNIRH